MMRVAVLTSSRADYGIYMPLLKKLEADQFFDLKLIAFGTHLSRFHGYTINQILEDGFSVEERLESLILGETEEAISMAIGVTITKFSSLWKRLKPNIDLVFALGDRYEMFAAVAGSVPFNISVAHIHGGETTLGAIDNKFRHAITLMSDYHFVATREYADKVTQLIGRSDAVYHVGALSLDNLNASKLLTLEEFKNNYQIDLSLPTILSTFHPETVSVEKSEHHANILTEVFDKLSRKYQIIITMPNADTMGMLIRKKFANLIKQNQNVTGVENFGTLGYFSCMRSCSFLLGNTSSGIIEAASFGKYVINLGHRQDGRIKSGNVIDCPIEEKSIILASKKISINPRWNGSNFYYKEGASKAIKNILKGIWEKKLS